MSSAADRDTPHHRVLRRLLDAGHEALFVGGAVRDHLLGRAPTDWDVATSAAPEEVIALFPGEDVDVRGRHFGVVVVDGVEVAMFRGEEYLVPGKPAVRPATSFAADAARRDFTVNAIGLTIDGAIVDPVGGLADLRAGLIRAVGEPEARFREDPARLLRAVTLAARLGFRIEPGTAGAIRRSAALLADQPVERVAKEIGKLLDARVLHRGLPLLHELGLLPFVLPELAHMPGTPQNPAYHHLDVWQHTVAVVRAAEGAEAPRAVVLAAVFHDVAKGLPGVRTVRRGQPSDIGHERAGAPIAFAAVRRLGFGTRLARRVRELVRFHLFRPSLRPGSVVRALRPIAARFRGSEELAAFVDELLQLMRADAAALAPGFATRSLERQTSLRRVIDAVLERVPFYPKDAGIDGAALGLTGPAAGERIRQLLLDAQSVAVRALQENTGR